MYTLFLILVFLSGITFAVGLHYYRTRSVIEERMSRAKPVRLTSWRQGLIKLTDRLTSKNRGWTDHLFDEQDIDAKLSLAGRPFKLTVNEYIGFVIALAGLGAVTGTVLALAQAAPPWFPIGLAATAWAVPKLVLDKEAAKGRTMAAREIVELCDRLSQGLSAGHPAVKLLEWASEGEGILAKELREVIHEVRLNRPLHEVFNKLAVSINLPEADELALSLKHASVHGTAIASHLRGLAKEFRRRRESDMAVQIAKLEPRITVALALPATIAVVCFIAAPLLVQTLKYY